MFVMHEPINPSSTTSPATSLRGLISSGSFGQAKSGSEISSKLMSITAAYSASESASRRTGFFIQSSISLALLSKVFGSW